MGKERHQNIPASYLVLIKDNKVLLQRRFNTGYQDGKYSMVAGHVDKGETFTEAIIRETKEEAGIELKPENLKVAHVMHRDSGTNENNERVDVFFVADKDVKISIDAVIYELKAEISNKVGMYFDEKVV